MNTRLRLKRSERVVRGRSIVQAQISCTAPSNLLANVDGRKKPARSRKRPNWLKVFLPEIHHLATSWLHDLCRLSVRPQQSPFDLRAHRLLNQSVAINGVRHYSSFTKHKPTMSQITLLGYIMVGTVKKMSRSNAHVSLCTEQPNGNP